MLSSEEILAGQEALPLVSVIVPVFNPGPYLELALRSVAQQTYRTWQLIVIDDGSTEDIDTICRRFDGLKLKLIRQERAGVSVARNRGILHADGEYIAFLDQDDVWMPTKLQRQVDVMQSDDGAGICHTAVQLIGSDGDHLSDHQPDYKIEGKEAKGYMSSGILTASCVLVSRKALFVTELFDPRLNVAGDTDVWLRICNHYKVAFVESAETCYRLHAGNQSKRREAGLAEIRLLNRKHASYAERTGDRRSLEIIGRLIKEAPRHHAAQVFDQARQLVRSHRLLPALALVLEAAMIEPDYVFHSLLLWFSARKRN